MKFVCSEKTEKKFGPPETNSWYSIVFTAQYDTTIDEDKRFSEATPSGRFEVTVKESVANEYVLGKAYYFYSAEIE